MIDIESKVFSLVSAAVKAAYSTATVSGEYVDVPASFPCVTLVESDNATYTGSLTADHAEHHASVTYDVNVYSNAKTGKKAQAKAIMAIIDNVMLQKNFTRLTMFQTPNVDRTIYRLSASYSAVVSEGTTSGSTTTYTIYRN